MAKSSSKVNQFFKDKDKMAQEERFNAQCYLMYKIDELLNERKDKKIDEFDNFLCIDGDPSIFLGRIMNRVGKEKLINDILPYELSSLVPMFRLFKVLPDQSDKKKLIQQEFFFDSTINQQEILNVLENKKSRSVGAGLQDCSWEFIGSNPAEAKRLVKVNMKILFSSMYDMIRKTSDGLSFMDLITPPNKSTGQLNQSFHKIKMTVGWSVPPASHELFSRNEQLLNAIKDSQLSVYLHLYQHDINFEQNGKFVLTANFWGRLEGAFEADGNSGFDIFEDSQQDKSLEISTFLATNLQKRLELFECIKRSQDKAKKTDKTTKLENDFISNKKNRIKKSLEKIREQLSEYIVDGKKKKYEKLLTALIKSNKIYYIVVDRNSLGVFDDKVLNGGDVDYGSVIEVKKTSLRNQSIRSFEQIKNGISSSKRRGGTLSNRSVVNSRIPKVDGNLIIHYFHFGDLMDVILDEFYDSKDKEERYYMRTLFGSFANPHNKNEQINLCDIPVSLNLFSVWFSEKVIKRGRETYPYNEFLRDITSGLLAPIMNHPCVQKMRGSTKESEGTRIRIGISLFSLKGTGQDGRKEPILSKEGRWSRYGWGSVYDSTVRKRLSPERIVGALRINEKDEQSLKPDFEYMFMYCLEEHNYRIQNYEKDANDGIYHFFPGTNSGILKQLKFVNQTQAGLKEAVMQGTNLEWLKRLYDAELTLFGIVPFIPGQKVFVNTEPIGLGISGDRGSLSTELGLGGYYVITNVKGSLTTGKLETVLTCKWESRGDGFGYKSNNDNLDSCIDKYLNELKKTGQQNNDSFINSAWLFVNGGPLTKEKLKRDLLQGNSRQIMNNRESANTRRNIEDDIRRVITGQ